MATEQAQFAARIRETPTTIRNLLRKDDPAIRHRPAPGEWSAIEVLGHMIDKMYYWSHRVERILHEERPTLPGYDQDAEVRKHNYQDADAIALLKALQQQCEHFATLVESIPFAALQREGVHTENGPMTLQQCIEAPLNSVPEHLAQLHAAQSLV
ncbi:MAG: hypothetical protein NVS4B11_31150 [Ktedonobacteraceae bacterium]